MIKWLKGRMNDEKDYGTLVMFLIAITLLIIMITGEYHTGLPKCIETKKIIKFIEVNYRTTFWELEDGIIYDCYSCSNIKVGDKICTKKTRPKFFGKILK